MALGRDAPDWCLKNGFPACTYKLKGEDKLIFAMLLLMDSNDSLKCILRKDKGFDEDGVSHRGDSEHADPRAADAGGDYLVFRERVDRWTKERLAEEVEIRVHGIYGNGIRGCEERWKNLTEELTAKMWGIFDETGMDMAQSGELAKYPLAIVNALLDAFGADLGIRYDIGCGHSTTIRHSPLGPSRCWQAIRTYFAHLDTFETYANLSTFLVNNYKQAIEILDTEESLKYAMEQAGVTEDMLKSRIQEEKVYLNTLLKEPQEETNKMEYYQLLVNLAD
ncbi:hypothetical protein DFH08DRAFT_815210 [Mycena albidolilacea]|uniref:Uncharacterized protein n=1 Tax=Mycena albidolilacea TaxID=1033008 RepID=A0AAD6ZME8_9AGAR|nr:hypothetical protein DFH08DRAFT_815210 [Mycena albidolilacea]